RIVRTVVILLVAGDARRAQAGEPAAAVALLARDREVNTGEREAGPGMIEPRVRPDRDRMAFGAVEREAAGGVVRILRREVLRPVAVHAFRRHRDERQPPLGRGLVAGLAIDGEMRSAEGKTRLLVRAHHAGAVQETPRRMAASAVVTELPAVNVLVARCAACRHTLEIERRVTRPACRLRGRADQGHAPPGVVELRADAGGHPPLRAVADGAFFLELAVRVERRLLRRGPGPCDGREGRTENEAP